MSFHYPKNAKDYPAIKDLVVVNGGTVVTVEDIATVKLLPIGGAKDTAGGEYTDVSFVHDSVELGSLKDIDLYVVSKFLPVPLSTRQKERAPSRAVGRNASRSTERRQQSSPERERPVSPTRNVPNRRAVTETPERERSPINGSPFKNRELPWNTPRRPDRFMDPIPLRGRTFFSDEDDMKLVEHIVKHMVNGKPRPGFSANGQKLWKLAEEQDIVPGRTWQSMEGRYKKHLRVKWAEVYPKYEAWRRNR
jgi:hypothetical protein